MATTPGSRSKVLKVREGATSVPRKRSKKTRQKALDILQDPDAADPPEMLCTRSAKEKVVNVLRKNESKLNLMPCTSLPKKRASKAAAAVVSPMNPRKCKTLMENMKIVYKNPYSGEDDTRKKVTKIPAELKLKLFQTEASRRRSELQSANRPLTLAEKTFLIETEVDQDKLEILHQNDYFDLTQQSVPGSDDTLCEICPEKSVTNEETEASVAGKVVISILSSPSSFIGGDATCNFASDGVALILDSDAVAGDDTATDRPSYPPSTHDHNSLSPRISESSLVMACKTPDRQNVMAEVGSSPLIVKCTKRPNQRDHSSDVAEHISRTINTGGIIANSQASQVSASDEEEESAIDESGDEEKTSIESPILPGSSVVPVDAEDPHTQLLRDITRQIMGNTLARGWWSRILAYDPLPINEFTQFLRETLAMAAIDKSFVQEWADFAGVTLKNDGENKRGKRKRVKSKKQNK